MESRLWMVAYDVADDRRRRRLERGLQALGVRVQYSVFECWLTLADARSHLGRLAAGLDGATDSLRAYPLCAWCAPAVTWIGQGEHSEDIRVFVV
jgi:CRISPR-associated protein Cas2